MQLALPGPLAPHSIGNIFADAALRWAELLSHINALTCVTSCRIVHLAMGHADPICTLGEPWPDSGNGQAQWTTPDIANTATAVANPTVYVGLPLVWTDGSLFGTVELLTTGAGDDQPMLQALAAVQDAVEDDLARLSSALEETGTAISLALEHARVLLAGAGHRIGFWDYQTVSDRLDCDAGWYAILGVDGVAHPIGSVKAFRPYVHPADFDAAIAIDGETLRAFIASESDYEHNFRITRADGEVRLVSSVARMMSDSAGNPSRVFGGIVDITGVEAGPGAPDPMRALLDRAENLARRGSWLHEVSVSDGARLQTDAG